MRNKTFFLFLIHLKRWSTFSCFLPLETCLEQLPSPICPRNGWDSFLCARKEHQPKPSSKAKHFLLFSLLNIISRVNFYAFGNLFVDFPRSNSASRATFRVRPGPSGDTFFLCNSSGFKKRISIDSQVRLIYVSDVLPPARKGKHCVLVFIRLLLSPFSSACLWREIGASRPMGPEAEDKVRSCTQKQIA